MLPTKENIQKHKEEVSNNIKNQSFDNFANLGNLLIENFIKNKNLDTLKLIIYLAKLNTEFNNVIEKMEDSNEIVNFEVPIEELCLFFNINRESFRKKLYKIRKTEVSFYCKEENGIFDGYVFPAMIIKKEVVKIKMFKIIFKELKKNLQDSKQKGYTNIKFLDRLNKLNKFNAYRMFIFLNRIRDYKYQNKTLNLDEFNGYFDVNYKNLKDIKKNILKPLEEDLKGLIPFSYEDVFDNTSSTGRKPLIAYKIIYKSIPSPKPKENIEETNISNSEFIQENFNFDDLTLDEAFKQLEQDEANSKLALNDGSTSLRKSFQDLVKENK